MKLKLFILTYCLSQSINAVSEPTANNNTIQGTVATVGPGPNCTFDTTDGGSLQSAIAGNFEEIRLVNNVIYTGSFVVNYNISLKGGYNSCTDATNDVMSTTPSTLDGNQLDSVLILNGNNGLNILENIQLTNGNSADFGGGLLLNGLNQNVNLVNSKINNNRAGIGGGGIYKRSNATINLNIADSLVNNNEAVSGAGGGVNFQGDGKLVMYGNSEISNNVAPKGGGIFFRDTQAVLVGGDNLTATAGISSNTAHHTYGGGLWIEASDIEIIGGLYPIAPNSGTNASVVGNPNKLFNMTSNALVDGYYGAAIFMFSNSSLSVSGVSITGSSSSNINTALGLVIYVENSSLYLGGPLYPSLDNSCSVLIHGCNEIAFNTAGSSASDSIFQFSNSSIQINRTQINNNNSSGNLIANANSIFEMTNTVIHDNISTGSTFYNGGHNAEIQFSGITAVGNNAAGIMTYQTQVDTDISYSYFYNPNGGQWYTYSTNEDIECVVVDVFNNVDHAANHVYAVNDTFHQNQFVDYLNRDLHLNDTADLIDFGAINCDAILPAVPRTDIDGHGRTSFPDIGADESLINDLIFINGFESI